MSQPRVSSRRKRVLKSEAQKLFIRALSQGASVRGAAEAGDRWPGTFYRWRNQDFDFAERWDAAVEAGTDRLEDEAVLRATSGVSKPIFYGGKLVGHEKRHSDALLMFLLKARRPDKFDPANAKPKAVRIDESDSSQFMDRIEKLLEQDDDLEDKPAGANDPNS